MENTLISFETAKIAKNKGVNIPCFNHYFLNGGDWEYSKIYSTNQGSQHTKLNYNNMGSYVDSYIARFEQSLLQKWLREEHDIHICVKYKGLYFGDVSRVSYMTVKFREYKTYEEALEAGLLEGLKLIG